MKDHYHYFGVFYLFLDGKETFTNGFLFSRKKLNRSIICQWEIEIIENVKERVKKENVSATLHYFKEISCDCEGKDE